MYVCIKKIEKSYQKYLYADHALLVHLEFYKGRHLIKNNQDIKIKKQTNKQNHTNTHHISRK